LWVNATYGNYTNELLRCSSDQSSDATASISHWEKAGNYTNLIEFENFKTSYDSFVDDIQEQVDKKADIYYQGTDPARYVDDTTDTTKKAWGDSRIGDLWRCTSATSSRTSTITETMVSRSANTEWIWKKNDGTGEDGGYGWHEMEIPDNIFDAYDGKATLYVSEPDNYKENDLWIVEEDKTYNTYRKHTTPVLLSTLYSANTYNKEDWKIVDSYTWLYTFLEHAKEYATNRSSIYLWAQEPEEWSDGPKENHVGDLLIKSQLFNAYAKCSIYTYISDRNSYGWMELADNIDKNVASHLKDKLGKSSQTIWLNTPTSQTAGNWWFLTEDLADEIHPIYISKITKYKKGTLLVANDDSTYFNFSDWSEKTRYTDDTAADAA
jgi:hypothetical protein